MATMPGDRVATRMLLASEYELAKADLASTPAIETAEARAAGTVGHECQGVLEGAPDESVIEEEGPLVPEPKLSGRAQGERARSEQEKQTIDLELAETIFAAAYRVVRRPYRAFIATAERLAWSDPTINALVHQDAAQLREALAGPPLAVCAEMRAWAASGFHILPPGSKSLKESTEAHNKQAVKGNLEMLLRSSEDQADRMIIRRTDALKEKLKEDERTDEVLFRAQSHMELALGEKLSRFVKQRLAPAISKGRTSAGTTFVIRPSLDKRSSHSSCRHEVELELHEGNSGSSGGVCLSERAHSQPSGGCSGPVQTVELGTPPDVRRARVRFSNGRTVTVPVIKIPAKYGGPAGFLIDAFRGYNPHPVSVQELSSSGSVIHTVSLRRVRCVKETKANAVGPPEPVNLATVTNPSGETLTIAGILHRVGGETEFSLGLQPGMRTSQGGEERGDHKQFQWILSTECAPHPYSLLDGILLPPGASVLVRTPTGLVALTKVELATSIPAQGPLFYGVYTTPPTEIVVERPDGSVLYTESLTATATEETEFCEGYAEQ
ncbi:MAG TPA: hypothetical protein VK790_04355 [Solirubrobacteraceae bacterium]|nr:hypothetical protein [Solirubrobacteraceae bacterium]